MDIIAEIGGHQHVVAVSPSPGDRDECSGGIPASFSDHLSAPGITPGRYSLVRRGVCPGGTNSGMQVFVATLEAADQHSHFDGQLELAIGIDAPGTPRLACA